MSSLPSPRGGSPTADRCSAPDPESSGIFSLRHRHRPWVAHQKLVALSLFGDAAVVLVAMLAAYLLRFETGLRQFGVIDPTIDLHTYLGHVGFGSLVLVLLLMNFRAHDPRHFLAFRKTVAVLVKSCVIWFAAFLGLALALKVEPAISRVYCVMAALVALGGLLVWRWILHCILSQEPFAGALRQRLLFVGWNDDCEAAVERFNDGRAPQMEVIGVVPGASGGPATASVARVPVLGRLDEVRRVIRESGADVVMAVDGELSRAQRLELAETCGKEFVDFKLLPSCFEILVSGLQLESCHGLPVLGVGRLPLHHAFNHWIKRGVDVLGALVGLVVFAPVMALFALLVKLESPGPVIYRQRRIGLNGRPFEIFKIRSMKPDAEAAGEVGWTVENDPRRLKVGEFMRRWNIDELPQFWNVLLGDMSLVGPRPERPELIEGFKEEIRHYNVRHNVKPGVTGWAQVHGLRGDTCLLKRLKFDLHYIEHWNLLLDFKIMVMTFLTRKGAC